MACSLRFYGNGISFWVVLSQSSDSKSFLVVYTLFSQDGCQREGFWEVVRHVVSPFDLSRTLVVGGALLVLCSLPGPVIKQLVQMVTIVPGQSEWFQSVCFPYKSYEFLRDRFPGNNCLLKSIYSFLGPNQTK